MNDNDKSIERAEGQLEGIGFATELLKQLKDTIHRLWILIIVIVCLWTATIGVFVWYLNQYDYTSTYEYTATGVNAIIDNDGNVIAQDVPDEMIIQILEILNDGNSEGENNQNAK